MGSRVTYYLLLLQVFSLFLFSGHSMAVESETFHSRRQYHDTKELHQNTYISTCENDITTPITTIPTPTTPNISPSPNQNPNSEQDAVSPTNITPIVIPPTVTTATSPGASWCVAAQGAAPSALQVALDYACGYGGADCSAIQPGGNCYNPNTLHDHACFAFNNFYQKNPIPSSCNFGGTAVTTNTDPSTSVCRYPSTSTSTSVLNTTNSNGATVFGAVPATPSIPSEVATIDISPYATCLVFVSLLLTS